MKQILLALTTLAVAGCATVEKRPSPPDDLLPGPVTVVLRTTEDAINKFENIVVCRPELFPPLPEDPANDNSPKFQICAHVTAKKGRTATVRFSCGDCSRFGPEIIYEYGKPGVETGCTTPSGRKIFVEVRK